MWGCFNTYSEITHGLASQKYRLHKRELTETMPGVSDHGWTALNSGKQAKYVIVMVKASPSFLLNSTLIYYVSLPILRCWEY